MDAFLKRPISHRGLHDNKEIIENTLESFDASINKNFATECDIILSKDEEVMVFHDFNLKRLTEINMLVNECNAPDLRKIKLLKIQIRSAQNVGKVWISRKKQLPAPFGAI